MEAASEAVDRSPDDPALTGARRRMHVTASTGAAVPEGAPLPAASLDGARRRRSTRTARLSVDVRRELLWITTIYLAARALLIVVAVLNDAFGHHSLQGQLAHWDGLWYRNVALHGYPDHVSFAQTNLGFFPLFPIAIYLVSPVLQLLTTHNEVWAATFGGVLVSGAGGLVATVFVHRLAEGWWDRDAARRATVLFVVFPGSVVFSMVYSEGLLLPLTAICIWALERRRWVLAGVCAGLGTAVQPVGLLLGLVCASVALRELWQHGWRARSFWAAVMTTAMSAIGAVSFMAFLWAWTGNPFANYIAQHHGWSEKTNALALVDTWNRMIPAFDPHHFNHPTINLNLVVGIVGAVIMAIELVLLWLSRREVSLPAIVWTLGITFFAFTSEYVPPNPRMVITAFPMLMLVGRWMKGRGFATVVWLNGIALAGLSLLTFTAHILRP